jgi:hypothetical protein
VGRRPHQDERGPGGEEEKMGIEGVGNGKVIPIEWLRALRCAAPADAPSPGRSGGAADSTGLREEETAADSVGGRERLAAELARELEKLPDVRREKVLEAKLRISTGYYDREDVRREILRSLLASILPPREQSKDDGVST